MKRALWVLGIAVVSGLVLFAAAAVASNAAWKRAGRTEWPSRLGMLEELPARFPKAGPSAEALRLAELAKPLGLDFGQGKRRATATDEAIANFVFAECARDVAGIEAPPAAVAGFLTQHAGAIDAVSAHLRQSRDIAWTVDLDQGFNAPTPNLVGHVRLSRVLVARALVRARSGDPGAWEDLEAASMLDRSLRRRPEMVSQIIALAFARTVNAAAWKLPVPAPGWHAEYQAIDRRRPLLQGLQTDSWTMWRNVPSEYSGPLQRVHLRASIANLVMHQRETADEVSRQTACAFDGTAYAEKRAQDLPWWNTVGRIAFVNAPWNRVLRYQAEREATANALRVRSGQPVMELSQCSDGSWLSENGRIRFTREIASNEKDMPLSLHIR
jgi:hypothetical protein